MFSELIKRNSKRNWKDNILYAVSMILAIVAFYIILSLDRQDVMVFLKEMERVAVNKLLALIPMVYVVSLFLLYFLIYFTDKYQMERRSHEFGTYLMLGMKKRNLFQMLFLEDLRNSGYALLIGIPCALLPSEIISLVTARAAGFGILRHQFTLSVPALICTVVGFLSIKLLARLVLCAKLWKKEVYDLLYEAKPERQKTFSPKKSCANLVSGLLFLVAAYGIGCGILSPQLRIWTLFGMSGLLCFLGILGTFCLFRGLAYVFDEVCRRFSGKNLWTFTFRQIQESVFLKSGSLAVASLMMLFAIVCCSYGISISRQLSEQDMTGVDFTFDEDKEEIDQVLSAQKADQYFLKVFEVRNGLLLTDQDIAPELPDDRKNYAYDCKELQERTKQVLGDDFWRESPYLIAESGYNEILRSKGKVPLNLQKNQMAIYGHPGFLSDETVQNVEQLLEEHMSVQIEGMEYEIIPRVCNDNLVADQMLTIMSGLIVPDQIFDAFVSEGSYSYWNGILNPDLREEKGMLEAVMSVNDLLKTTDLQYESYLGSAGRQMFYRVAAGYITIYLAIIFLIIANTLIGVQFLIQQEKTKERYRVLIALGSSYEEICDSCSIQIWWYYGLTLGVAFLHSIFGVRTLAGLFGLSRESITFWWIAAGVILLLFLMETAYIMGMIKISDHRVLKFVRRRRQE